MRAVVQRVRRASVTVEGSVAGEIAARLLVFVGMASDDGPTDVEYIVNKTRELRIFPDEHGRMNRSVVESGGAVLVVSQFTLQADCRKGRRPGFSDAAPPEAAVALYETFVCEVQSRGITTATGRFREHMEVALVNDGPVTILLDSRKTF